MEITRLDAKGFKSFGDKIAINFDKGITGIVGPNGCGKSNVVDAIRWVLGEQKTRALRSDKMENVIFNGSKKRKAMQMAEVSLTFNNTKNILPTEYSHVTITRRYFRSGESEYLLNNVNCRLKDITNLFLDTGIGPDSYAIIELKMVDDILQNKEGARKQLFEEAAGISKFKIRKRQTLKKLEETDKDLERVEDLLFEIEKNMRSLERQAKQAEKYFELKNIYKASSVQLARLNIEKQSVELTALENKIRIENDQKSAIQVEISKFDAKIEEGKRGLIQKEKLLSTRQKALNEHVAKIRSYESEKNIKNERLKFLTSNLDKLTEQLDIDKKSNERALFSIKSLKEDVQKVQEELDQKNSTFESLEEEYSSQKEQTLALQKACDELLAGRNNIQQELYQLEKNQEINQIQLKSLTQQLEKATTDTGSKAKDVADFTEKIQILEGQIKKQQTVYAHLKEQEVAHNSKIEKAEREVEKVREQKIDLGRKLDARENEYKLTKSLVDNLEGYPEAIKFLKKSAEWTREAPLLSDVLTTDDQYKLAIENFLEPFLNYYVVEDLEDALKAVNMLSDASKGKANFFILSHFDKYVSQTPVILNSATPASEVVEYDVKYKKLVQYLLDNVYLIQDIKSSDPKLEGVVWISTDGKIVRRKYSLSGGSVGLFEGKRIGRVKNLEKLQKEILKLKANLKESSEKLEKRQKELEELKYSNFQEDIEKENQTIQQLKQDLVTFQTRKEQFQDIIESSSGQKENIDLQIRDILKNQEESTPQLDKARISLEKYENDIAVQGNKLEEEKVKLTSISQTYNEANILKIQSQNKLNSIVQDISHKESNFDNSKERIEKNQSEISNINEEIKTLLQKTESTQIDLISMYEEKENLDKGVNEAEKDYYASRNSIDEFEKSLRETQRRKEVSESYIHKLEEDRNEQKLRFAAIKERLSVEFEVDLDRLLKEDIDLSNLDEHNLKEEVRNTKDKLDKIGPINPMALEAYDEIKQRYDFIIEQRQDLNEAKESLLSTISEIDAVARETFEKAFVAIRDNFQKVFRTLFTEEDSCDLKLIDPDDPVGSEIEIIAQPKGKRPLTISQLSGGEKTLTAISLLFAIYLLKPAPFCIFDEVDAPLDDANIDKFNNIIREFSNESQFIIVTHNKRTMSSTDVIYGITMVENGVSRVVPVDLRELN